MRHVEDLSLKPVKLVNGALVQQISDDCKVCYERGEEPEPAGYECQFDGMTLKICKAHCQELLDMNDDQLQKGEGLFGEFFRIR